VVCGRLRVAVLPTSSSDPFVASSSSTGRFSDPGRLVLMLTVLQEVVGLLGRNSGVPGSNPGLSVANVGIFVPADDIREPELA
jgi:hypothetical protein